MLPSISRHDLGNQCTLDVRIVEPFIPYPKYNELLVQWSSHKSKKHAQKMVRASAMSTPTFWQQTFRRTARIIGRTPTLSPTSNYRDPSCYLFFFCFNWMSLQMGLSTIRFRFISDLQCNTSNFLANRRGSRYLRSLVAVYGPRFYFHFSRQALPFTLDSVRRLMLNRPGSFFILYCLGRRMIT